MSEVRFNETKCNAVSTCESRALRGSTIDAMKNVKGEVRLKIPVYIVPGQSLSLSSCYLLVVSGIKLVSPVALSCNSTPLSSLIFVQKSGCTGISTLRRDAHKKATYWLSNFILRHNPSNSYSRFFSFAHSLTHHSRLSRKKQQSHHQRRPSFKWRNLLQWYK